MNPIVRCLAAASAALLLSLTGAAQQVAPETDLSVATVQAQLADIEASTTIDEATRATAAGLYREAIEDLKRADEAASRIAEYARLSAEAPGLLESIRADLAQPAPSAEPVVAADATLAQVEQSLSQARAELEGARRAADDLQTEAGRRADRRTTIPDQLAANRRRLAEIEDSLKLPPSNGESAEVAAARRVLLLAKKAAILREIEAADQEAASYDARRELLPLRRDRALRRVAEGERLVNAWERIANDRRLQEAERAKREAQRQRREAARKYPALQRLAEENESLAASRSAPDGVTKKIAEVTAALTSTNDRLNKIREQFRAVRRKVEISGLNKATGALLRRQYETLEEQSTLHRQAEAVHDQMTDAEYRLVLLEEDRSAAGDIDAIVRRTLADVPPNGSAEDRAEMEAVARELVTAQRDLLDQLISDYTTYLNRLIELNTACRDLEDINESYRGFIEERILWVHSVAGEAMPDLSDAGAALFWLFDPGTWRAAASSTIAMLMAHWSLSLLAAAALAALLSLQNKWRRTLRRLASEVSSYKTDAFSHTIAAIACTFLLAIPLPALVYALGWLLARPTAQPDAAVAAGLGLQAVSAVFFPLEFVRRVLRPGGLAEAHFRWPTGSVQLIRRHLRWFIPSMLPLVFVVVAMDRQTHSELWSDSLGRIAFMIGQLLLATLVQRLLRPGGGVMREYLSRAKGGWLDRLRYLWYPLAIGLPLSLIALAWVGYFYTALQLYLQLRATFLLILALVLINAVLIRWLFVARRRLAVEAALRRREQARAADAGSSDVTTGTEVEKIDIPAIDAQTQSLFRTVTGIAVLVGLLVIWADVLPALRMLERVQVWPRVAVLESPVTAIPESSLRGPAAQPAPRSAAEGAAEPAPGGPVVATPGTMLSGDASQGAASEPDQPMVVTLADIGLTLVIIFMTIVAVRNLPGLIEIVLLQRLPLDSGSRYALSTVARYTILIIGGTAAFSALGIPWSKVQWIVAALTFGLAFGLQEIFANFMSGLIILGERPIRVGDTVTIGGVSGTVTKIRMRATTILDWDRKELIVPNKAFVTDQLINWTLSDPVLRITVPVGVSYGADVDRTEEILLRVARGDEVVLTDPPPQALFLGFGDSALNFELRVYIPHIEHLLTTRHRLHRAITKAFRKAGIEIAFPQRDLHLRSAEGLKEIVQKRELLPEAEVHGVE